MPAPGPCRLRVQSSTYMRPSQAQLGTTVGHGWVCRKFLTDCKGFFPGKGRAVRPGRVECGGQARRDDDTAFPATPPTVKAKAVPAPRWGWSPHSTGSRRGERLLLSPQGLPACHEISSHPASAFTAGASDRTVAWRGRGFTPRRTPQVLVAVRGRDRLIRKSDGVIRDRHRFREGNWTSCRYIAQ